MGVAGVVAVVVVVDVEKNKKSRRHQPARLYTVSMGVPAWWSKFRANLYLIGPSRQYLLTQVYIASTAAPASAVSQRRACVAIDGGKGLGMRRLTFDLILLGERA